MKPQASAKIESSAGGAAGAGAGGTMVDGSEPCSHVHDQVIRCYWKFWAAQMLPLAVV